MDGEGGAFRGAFSERYVGAGRQGLFDDGLEQTVRSHLDADGVLGNVFGRLFEQHGTQQIVGVIFGRAIEGQVRSPSTLGYRRRYPFART